MNNNALLEIKQCLSNLFSEINLMRKKLESAMELMSYANFHQNSIQLTKEVDISDYQTTVEFLKARKLAHLDSEFIGKLALVLSRQMDQTLIYISIKKEKIYLFPDLVLEKALIYYQDRN